MVCSWSCILLQIVFLVKGPLYLVAISATEEPDEVIRSQLELLHAQVCLCFWYLCPSSGLFNNLFDSKELPFISCLYMQNFNAAACFYAGVNLCTLSGSFDRLTCSIFLFWM